MVLVLIVASFSAVPLVGADHTADEVPSDETIQVTENVDVWERSIFPLRVTTEPDKAIPNAQWFVVDDKFGQKELKGKETVGAYTRAQEKVNLKFQVQNANWPSDDFEGKDTHLIAAHIEENVSEDDLPEDPQNMTTDEALEFLTHENVNANASFYDAGKGPLDDEGSRVYSFPLGDKPTGQYVFFLAVNETQEDGFVVNDDNELSSTGHSTIVGVDTMMLQAGHSGVNFKNKDSANRGDDLTFSVDVSDDLKADSVEHTIIVYDEATGFKDQEFTFKRSGEVKTFEDISKNTTLKSSVKEVNGVAKINGNVEHTGIKSLDVLIQEVASKASPETEYDVTNGPLDASLTSIEDAGTKETITVETLGDWAKDTPYRWVHIAVGEDSSDVITDTGTFRFGSGGGTTDPGDGTDDGSDDETDDSTDAPAGGGGGTGGLPAPSTITDVSAPGADGTNHITVSNAQKGQVVRMKFTSVDTSINGMAFDQINLVPGVNGNFEMSVTPLASAPSSVSGIEGTFATQSVGYFQIDHDIADSDINGVEFTFKVEKSKLQGQNLDNVALYRHHDGSWTALETEHVGSSGNFHRFSADSPGLSVFAVGVKQADISVTDAALQQSEIGVGDTATVEATVTNNGDGTGSHTVEMMADGETVAQKTVDVAGGESKTVELTSTFDTAGDYEITVNDVSAGTLSVTDDSTGETTTDEPTTTTPGDEEGGMGLGAWVLIALVLLAIAGGAVYYVRQEQL